MKLKPDINIPDFFKAIKACQGNIYFKTDEGDILNLNSALSQWIFITVMDSKDFLLKGNIECTEPDDRKILAEYLT